MVQANNKLPEKIFIYHNIVVNPTHQASLERCTVRPIQNYKQVEKGPHKN